MLDTLNVRTTDMPADMRILFGQYPRDSWETHPGFREETQHWLGAPQMFRRLGTLVRTETERYLDQTRAPDSYATRLSYYGDALVQNLHGHHSWEDHSYFPELSAADSRFDAGLAILEKDHQALNGVLDAFIGSANRAIKLIRLDEKRARDEAGNLHGVAETIEALLLRHLSDEEELAVPIILHYRLRG